MKKQYWYVLLTYIVMHISTVIGPLFLYKLLGLEIEIAINYSLIFSFSVALVIVLYLLRQDMTERHLAADRSTRGDAVWWSIAGVFLAYFSQIVAVMIELYLLGIQPGSENTQEILKMIQVTPVLVVVTSIIGPILEEIVFRQIVFGSLHKKFNFVISALLSLLICAVVHMDFSHILIYTAMGFTFAFLYVKTKRIPVPIVAHVTMNTLVVIMQLLIDPDEIERILKEYENIQSFISFFF